MSLAALRSRARQQTLEVEHLLSAAKRRIPGLEAALDEMSARHGWSERNRLADGTRVVPLARWARVAGRYASGGIAALAPLAAKPADACFVISLLESLHSPEAVDALATLFPLVIADPAHAPRTAWQLAEACNLLLSTPKSVVVATAAQAGWIRRFLAACLGIARNDRDRATVAYALRGVGDASSLALVAAMPPLSYPWDTALALVSRVLRRRIAACTSGAVV